MSSPETWEALCGSLPSHWQAMAGSHEGLPTVAQQDRQNGAGLPGEDRGIDNVNDSQGY